MLHIYYGDGKGKTTAAMGFALRMAGRGQRVIVAQFLKGADSGERQALKEIPAVELLPVPEKLPFTFQMTADQREAERERYAAWLARLAGQPCGLLVLDEVCDAVCEGLVDEEAVLALLDGCAGEVILTGHRVPERFLERADYITYMEKKRHPFDRGAIARSGVEW